MDMAMIGVDTGADSSVDGVKDEVKGTEVVEVVGVEGRGLGNFGNHRRGAKFHPWWTECGKHASLDIRRNGTGVGGESLYFTVMEALRGCKRRAYKGYMATSLRIATNSIR